MQLIVYAVRWCILFGRSRFSSVLWPCGSEVFRHNAKLVKVIYSFFFLCRIVDRHARVECGSENKE
jgi:hypothetical protein